MKLTIAQLGQPVLWKPADPVSLEEIAGESFRQLLRDMFETLLDEQGAGLAGPQVFASKRVFLAGVIPPAAEGERPGIEIFINPVIAQASEETKWSWEGCLSFPELLVLVERHTEVRVNYLNVQGQPKTLDLAGFPARVFQHENDHLDGILTLDRAASSRHIVKASEIEAVKLE